jgi:hypothetical protein
VAVIVVGEIFMGAISSTTCHRAAFPTLRRFR